MKLSARSLILLKSKPQIDADKRRFAIICEICGQFAESAMERETPVLCCECRQWLCAAKDSFCGYCGAQLVRAVFSCDKLILDGNNSTLFKISNQGRFNLYWAAEIISVEPSLRAFFAVSPDYGSLHLGSEQEVNIRFQPDKRGVDAVRAYIEISSNDPINFEVKLPILKKETDVPTDTERR